jgi:phosphoglycolate phosphatase
MLSVCGQKLDPRLIILDKDGTLMAFDSLWQEWYRLLKIELDAITTRSPSLGDALPPMLGYDADTGAWDPEGPLTLAATGELVILLAGVLYAHADLGWNEAVEQVRLAEQRARAALPVADLVQPIGDVAGTLGRWRDAGIRLAVATTDERDFTLRSLRILGIEDLVEDVLCGDDGVRLKPMPDMALWLCESLGVPPHQTLVIGDTTGDMAMARSAGAMAAVGVLSGGGSEQALARYTDLIIPDIHHIHLLPQEGTSGHA